MTKKEIVIYLVDKLNIAILDFKHGYEIDYGLLQDYGHSGIIHTIIQMYYEDIIEFSDIDELINDCLKNKETYNADEFIKIMED